MHLRSISPSVLAIALGAVVAACGQAAAPPAPPEEAPPAQAAAPVPPLSLAQIYKDCTWTETRGAGLSLWGFDCPTGRLVADETLPGVKQVYDGENGPGEAVVIQLFEIAEGADMSSIDPAVQAASPAETVELCTLQPSSPAGDMADWHEFQPTGTLKEAYEKVLAGESDEPTMPCGALGPSEGGGRFFKLLPGSTTKVAVVHFPSDAPSFDIDTLKAAN